MILKGFKEKSNEKYIDKTLKNRVVVNSNQKIRQLGILVKSNELIDYNYFKKLTDAMGVDSGKVAIIAFADDKVERAEEDKTFPVYSPKDLGWNGAINNKTLKHFVNADFDLLISYYTEDNIFLKLITTASKAKFKVGLSQVDERLNDLIIKTELSNFKIFKKELLKYLNTLNKI